MSSGHRGNYQNEYLDYTFDPTGANLPPPLRPPALNSAQVLAVSQFGFSDNKGGGNNQFHRPPTGNGYGRGRPQQPPQFQQQQQNGRNSYNSSTTDDSGFPTIDQFSLEDCVDGQQQQQQGNNSQEQEEGLLPALRRPNINEVPADVLAVVLKSSERFEEVVALQQQGQQQQYSDRGRQAPSHSSHYNNYPQPQQAQHQQNQHTPPRPQYQQQMQRGGGPPSNFPQGQQQQQQGSPTYNTSGGKSNIKVQLSVNAKEFVPSTPQRRQQEPIMTTQEESELMQALAQFQLQGQGQDYSHGASGDSQPQSYLEDNSDHVLSTVTDAIMDLTTHPANFKRCSKVVTEVLKQYCTDVDTLGVVVTLLSEQCISNPNFCYSGARLAEVLVKSGLTINNVQFKKLLLTRLQEQFQLCVDQMKTNPEIMPRCRGILMYFGELFAHIRIEKNGKFIPLYILGLGVLEMMQNLVKDPSHENIKSVFQVLKLVGWDLENSDNSKVKENFEQLMKDLSYLCVATTSIKPQTKLLLDTLFQLKSKKWNREEAEEAEQSPASSIGTSSNTIYELPDSDDDDDDDCILLDNEPEEVQKAYEEFLKNVKK